MSRSSAVSVETPICGHLEWRSSLPANNLQPTADLLLDRDHCDCDTIIFTDGLEALNHSRMGALLEGDVIGIKDVERHAA
jgi:hypothetical protein